MSPKPTTASRKQTYIDWITALRSGKYKQTQKSLRSCTKKSSTGRKTYGYCCLGVLCDLDLKQRNKRWKLGDAYHSDLPTTWKVEESTTGLPDVMLHHLGITYQDHASLVDKNDEHRLSFREIADYIENTLMPRALSPLNNESL